MTMALWAPIARFGPRRSRALQGPNTLALGPDESIGAPAFQRASGPRRSRVIQGPGDGGGAPCPGKSQEPRRASDIVPDRINSAAGHDKFVGTSRITYRMEPSRPSSPATSPATSPRPTTSMADLSVDALAHCADYLSLHDVFRLAMSSKFLRTVAYSDSVWLRLFRERWALLKPSVFATGVRDAYLDRLCAVRQFKFSDPLYANVYTDPRGCNLMLLDDANLFAVQGSAITVLNVDGLLAEKPSFLTLKDHNARVTCMRLFPPCDFSLHRNDLGNEENVLVTSSSDHSVRIWWKGSSRRCFKGHSGVSTLSDELLGDPGSRLLASGGEDGTVRLWSVSSSGKRGQHALKATLHGHEKAVKFLSIAEHKPSLLVSVSRYSKIRIWDTTASSAVRSSCCVGMACLSGPPVNIRCHDCLLYVASGSNVSAIDLRTMGTVMTAASSESDICSFQVVPSKTIICTGHNHGAMLWDVRKNQGTMKVQPVAKLDGHTGPVMHLYADSYKIITGSPDDARVRVWDAGTGTQTNNLSSHFKFGCSALAAKGTRVAIASPGVDGEFGVVQLRDFNHASQEFLLCTDAECEGASKFWESGSLSDDNSI